ncbi:LysR family transcriptional regulator [Methylobacterium indicum]|uniref:LysR family transcriptional regulator n=1 Tax=Methylobacterium indicum TaxID=1775910 RepID=A0ABR5H5X6_9HYPH|nr:LysR substrate-binding domain-containing protein [Methylobacterium indicum]KMO19626.1 LysR family transcriptional regulator [Methylobacterium indicum]KMO23531.1 LysR family transcriptional regulator [Methylobacterium indicum]
MQTTALRYFLAVARDGTIAAASARLNVAPSAISRQIANLEAELACLLFERRPRGMVLSQAGELLARHARQVLASAEQVVTEIRELEGLWRGLVRVATTEAFAIDLVPSVIAGFHARHPGIRFELSVLPPSQVTQRVIQGEADLGLTFCLDPSADTAVAYRNSLDMVALCAPDHPLAGQTVIGLSDIAAHPVALLPRDTTLRTILDAACRAEGIAIEPAFTSNALSALLPFVRLTRGLTLMSSIALPDHVGRGEFVALPIRSRRSLARGIEVQTMRDRPLPRAVQAFLTALVAALPRVGE